MNATDARKCFIEQVKFVNDIAKDIKNNNCSQSVIAHAKKYAHLENACGEFWRVNWGGAYAYVDIDENGVPTGNIWWNNEDLGCDGNFSKTIAQLKSMSDTEIESIEEFSYFEEDDNIDDFLPLKYQIFITQK